MTTDKGFTIDLNGSTVLRGSGNSSVLFDINPPGVTVITNRITNGTLNQQTFNTGFLYAIQESGVFTNSWYRVDHITILVDPTTSSGVTSLSINAAWGCIDHCNFSAPKNSEQVHNYGWGGSNGTNGWLDVVVPGTIWAVVFEDCAFTNNDTGTSFLGNSASQSYYGARIVVRHCKFWDSQIDFHGGASASQVGTRWWEIYLNDWYLAASENQDRYLAIRAGSGYVWSNTQHGTDLGAGNIDFALEGDSPVWHAGQGGPLTGGITPILVPCYCWSNSAGMNVTWDSNMVPGSAPGGSVNLVTNTPASYTPLIYPHPFVSNNSTINGYSGSSSGFNGNVGGSGVFGIGQ